MTKARERERERGKQRIGEAEDAEEDTGIEQKVRDKQA